MEEVDHIIIHTLKQIGCDVEEDVSSLRSFTTELVFEGAVRCLQAINSSLELPPKQIPPSMAARYRAAASLATACMSLGYTGEIGYQTFLYSNESELRKIFIFLIEKLPRDNEKLADEPLGSAALIQRTMSQEISDRLSCHWTPPYCKMKGLRWGSKETWHREGYKDVYPLCTSRLFIPNFGQDLGADLPHAQRKYWNSSHLRFVHTQTKPEYLIPSLLETNVALVAASNDWEAEWNQYGLESRLSKQEYLLRKSEHIRQRVKDALKQSLDVSKKEQKLKASLQKTKVKGSRFTHTEALQFTQEEEHTKSTVSGSNTKVSGEELAAQREQELKSMHSGVEELLQSIQKLALKEKQLSAALQQVKEQLETDERGMKDLEDSHRVKKQTYDLLPDAENNLQRLQALVEASGQRLINLANQWETHRAPLIEEYRLLKETSSQQLDESQRLVEEVRSLREGMREIAQDARAKDELQKQLSTEFEKLPKDVNRSFYTRRITEIVANIKKQKAEIDKVLLDTKSVQKDINQLSGKLDRTFTVVDELIFKDAKKDEAIRRAYKHLAALHENCSQLIQTVEETGAIMREIRDLEDQIEVESQKKVEDNLKRITADLKQMKQENSSLITRLKVT